MSRLGILGSTRGTVMQSLITAIEQRKINASIEIVVSNKKDAMILESARAHHLPAEFVDPNQVNYDKKISTILQAHQVELVVLIGYMRILSKEFIEEWRNQIINVHPSILPAFAGKMNHGVHRAVLESGVKETGCTVHYVTEDVDAGPILIQKKCPVLPDDTIETLKTKVQQLEGSALLEAITSLQ